MPDLDIIDRTVAPGWHRPYRLLAGDASPEEIGHAILQALSRSLRRGGGVSNIDALATIVDQVSSERISVIEALRNLRAAELSAGGDRHARVAARAAAELVVTLGQGAVVDGDAARAVAEGFCWALVDHQLFGRARPELVGQRFADYAEAIALEQECKEALRSGVARLSERLVRDPRARKLRAPRMPNRERRSTADLLHTPITL